MRRKKGEKPDSDDTIKTLVDKFLPTDDEKFKAMAVIVDALMPGTWAAWMRLVDAGKAILNVDALRGGDPVAVSAARIIQVVLIAVARRDKAALQRWERHTFAWMKENAVDDYVRLPLAPRERLDRHIILRELVRRIRTIIREQPHGSGMLETFPFAMQVGTLILAAFPSLKEVDGKDVIGLIHERFPKHVEKQAGVVRKVDPEAVLLDGMEALGVPREKAQGWLKATK